MTQKCSAPLVKRKIEIFLSARGKDATFFINDFHANNPAIDVSTIQSWLGAGGTLHRPNNNSLNLIVRYLQNFHDGKVPILRLTHFYDAFSPEEFEAIIRPSVGIGEIAIALPGGVTRMPEEMISYLRGTYYVYRNSFANHEMIAKETLVLSENERTKRVMDVLLFGISTNDSDYKNGACPNPERRMGKFFRYGRCFQAITAFAKIEANKRPDKRMCSLEFPQQEEKARYAHYGMVHGYSPSLGNPASGRVLAFKVSSSSDESDLGAARAWRLSRADSEVKDFVDLLDNHIAPEETALASNRASNRLKALHEMVLQKYWT